MPGATPIFSGEGFEAALVSVPTGTFSKHTLKAMRARDTRAKELGVPVLVKLGTTKFRVVLRWCDTDAVQVLGISVERSIRVSSGYRRA